MKKENKERLSELPTEPPGPDRSWMKPFGWGLVDPTQCKFEDWMTLIFDHPIAEPPWFELEPFDPGWAGSPPRFLAYCTELFQQSHTLLNRFSIEQIEQGFSYLLSAYGLPRWLWDGRIEISLKRQCVLSMRAVFKEIFSKQLESDVCYMWWDHLRNFDEESRDSELEQTILEVLGDILNIDSVNCQTSAIHGLGHLKHPMKRQVLQDFLASRGDLDPGIRQYALEAMEGNVL